MKCTVFIATSMDGYIADQNGSIAWLDRANQVVPTGEDCGYSAFFKEIDVLVMGRKTFDTVLGFGFWPYEGKRVVVLTSQDSRLIPVELSGKVEFSTESPSLLIKRLSGIHPNLAVYVDGGQVIRSFIKAGLIDEMIVTQIPVLLGSGISLFADMGVAIDLEVLSVQHFDFGYVQVHSRLKY